MREGLEQDLRKYNELAKKKLAFSEAHSKGERRAFKNDIGGEIETIFHGAVSVVTDGQELSLQAAKRVFGLQVAKQKIMRQLYQDLAEIDNEQYWRKRRHGGFDVYQEGGELFTDLPDGAKFALTIGDIVMGEQLGQHYNLDVSSCDRLLRKQWLLERAKEKLRAHLDYQLSYDLEMRGEKSAAYKIRAMAGMDKESGLESGHGYERLALSFFGTLAIDRGLDFDVRKGNAEEDAIQKVDLVLSRQHFKRGVEMEKMTNASQTVGVQVTAISHGKFLARKVEQNQIARQKYVNEGVFDDILLVVFSKSLVKQMNQALVKWTSENLPGGPERYLPVETREKLFKQVLKGMFTEEELNEQWAKVVGQGSGAMREPEAKTKLPPLAEVPPILAQNIEYIEHSQAAD